MKIFQKKKGDRKEERGVALLIAILIGSIALSVGLGVYNRTYKELIFASFWKQAQTAFAAADSGLECAIYWDTHPATNFTCFGNPSAVWPVASVGVPQTISMNVAEGCASVEIIKNASAPLTTIKSRGTSSACGTTPARRVERGLRVDY